MSPESHPHNNSGYQPLYHLYRADTVESVHHGAIAVVNTDGELYAWVGDPQTVTYLRSSAKPFQTIPLVESGAMEKFQITQQELAITCASHSGTDRHLQVITGLQRKIGISESDLLCCTHKPIDQASYEKLKDQGLSPSQNHHNCSGKHTGMLGQAVIMNASLEGYTEVDHPVQKGILKVFCEMTELESDQVALGRDGCSVPTFAVPLYRAARAWARLVDPSNLPARRADACRKITAAMMSHPFLVAGPGRLDTRLMEISRGKVLAKAGAEAFQALGIPPGMISPDSPGLGIAIKIADGDQGKRARRAVTLELLRQLNVLNTEELGKLNDLGPVQSYQNQCGIETGEGKPCFQLQYS